MLQKTVKYNNMIKIHKQQLQLKVEKNDLASYSSGVRFSKLPRTFRARKHFGALFGCFSRVPKSVSQNTRKCPELSPDIFRESFRVTGYDNATRAGGKIILEHCFIITTFNFSS